MSTSTIKRGLITRGVATKGLIFESEFAVTGELTSVITSGGSVSVNENVDADTAVYTATARDPNGVTSGFSFAISTGDSSAFTINSSTGVVTIDASPNFEAQPSYSFTVTATKSGQPTATKDVTIAVVNLDEVAPTITSGATATAIVENSGAGQVIYTVTVDDSADISGGVTFSKSGTDQGLISIDSTTGAVTLIANPDFETKPSYSFNVIATDAAGNSSTQAVTLAITNVVEISAPTWTSATHNIIASESTATNAEFVDLDTLINNPDGATITGFSFLSGNPGGQFSVDNSTHALKLNTTLDHSVASTHSLIIRMNYDLDGASGSTNIQININVAQNPVFTSSTSGEIYYDIEGYTTPVFYRPTTTLDSNASSVTYTVGGTDQSVLSAVNTSDSHVRLTSGATSHASKNSYSFTVTATDNLGGVTTTGALTATIVENRFANNAINTRGIYYQNDINKVDVAATYSGTSRQYGLLGHARVTNYENNLIAIDRTNPSGTNSAELLTVRADSDFNAKYLANNLMLQAQREEGNPTARYIEGETYRTDFVFFATDDTFDFGDGNSTGYYRMDPDHADYEVTAIGHSAEPRVYLSDDSTPSLRNSVRFFHSTNTSGIATLATNCPTGTEIVIYENTNTSHWPSGLDLTNQSDLGNHAWVINNGNGTISFATSPSNATAGIKAPIAAHVSSYNNSNAMKFLNVTHTQPHYVTAVDEGLVVDNTGATQANRFGYVPNDGQIITPFANVDSGDSPLLHQVLTTTGFNPFSSNIGDENFYLNGNLILQSSTVGDGTMVMVFSTTTGLVSDVTNFYFEEIPGALLISPTSLNYEANVSASSVIYTAAGTDSGGGGNTITFSLVGSTGFINSSNGSSVTPTLNSSTGEVTVPANTTANGTLTIQCSGSGLGSTTSTVNLYASERTDIEDTWKSISMRPTGGISTTTNDTGKAFHIIDIPYSDTFNPSDTHYLIFKGTTTNSPAYTNDVSIGWVQIFDASGNLVQSIAPEQGLWNTSKANISGGGFTLNSRTVQQAKADANRAIGTGNNYTQVGTYPNGVDGADFSGWQRLPSSSAGPASTNTGASDGVENSAYKLPADGGSNVFLPSQGDERLSQASNTGHVYMETSRMAQNREHYLRTVNAFLPPDGGTIRLAVHYASDNADLTDSNGVLDVAFAKV
jgi:hypothetical protein